MKALIVEDDINVSEAVALCFQLRWPEVGLTRTVKGREALEALRTKTYDMVILDINLPDMSGFDGLQELRGFSDVPVVILTVQNKEDDQVKGLELGADDYITKPFSPKILTARVRRVLQRHIVRNLETSPVKIHEISIDPARHEVTVKNKPVELTFTEFNILYTLAKRPGMVFTRYQIVDAIRGSDYLVTDRAIDVQIVSLRKKLGTSGKYIETVRGIGYKFKD